MSKAKIYEFDPVIYPRKLWVVTDPKALEEFYYCDDKAALAPNDYDVATTYYDVARKDSKNVGVVIFIRKGIDVNTVAHESGHAAFAIFRMINANIEFKNTEPYCYLLGWIAGCIDKVRTNKIKDK